MGHLERFLDVVFGSNSGGLLRESTSGLYPRPTGAPSAAGSRGRESSPVADTKAHRPQKTYAYCREQQMVQKKQLNPNAPDGK